MDLLVVDSAIDEEQDEDDSTIEEAASSVSSGVRQRSIGGTTTKLKLIASWDSEALAKRVDEEAKTDFVIAGPRRQLLSVQLWPRLVVGLGASRHGEPRRSCQLKADPRPLWGGRRRAAEATASLRDAQAALWGAWQRPEPADGPGRQMGRCPHTGQTALSTSRRAAHLGENGRLAPADAPAVLRLRHRELEERQHRLLRAEQHQMLLGPPDRLVRQRVQRRALALAAHSADGDAGRLAIAQDLQGHGDGGAAGRGG